MLADAFEDHALTRRDLTSSPNLLLDLKISTTKQIIIAKVRRTTSTDAEFGCAQDLEAKIRPTHGTSYGQGFSSAWDVASGAVDDAGEQLVLIFLSDGRVSEHRRCDGFPSNETKQGFLRFSIRVTCHLSLDWSELLCAADPTKDLVLVAQHSSSTTARS